MEKIIYFLEWIESVISKIIFKIKRVDYKKTVNINGIVVVCGTKNRISIGNNTIINSGKYRIPIGYPCRTSFWILGNGKIEIGEACGISNSTICSMEGVKIGNHVLLGGGVKIYDTDFHSLNYLVRRDIEKDNKRRALKIVIEDDVFVGGGYNDFKRKLYWCKKYYRSSFCSMWKYTTR